jgi:hypothetical protein
MMLAGERSPFEMIEPQLGLDLLILLLDRPALMRETNELRERCRRGQIQRNT